MIGNQRLTTHTLPVIWVDAILLFTLCEWVFLSLKSAKAPEALSFVDVSLGLLPGFLLMVAVRLATPPDVPIEVFAFFALAGLAHALDFQRRYRQNKHY